MNAAEHRVRAEQLLAEWEAASAKRISRTDEDMAKLRAAQVHATLATIPDSQRVRG